MDRLRELLGELLLRGRRHQVDLGDQDPLRRQLLAGARDERRLAVAAWSEHDDVLAVQHVRAQLRQLVFAVGERLVEREGAVAEGVRRGGFGYTGRYYTARCSPAVEPPGRSFGWNRTRGRRRLGSGAEITARRRSTAVDAISSIGCSIVVRGGSTHDAASIPSNPTTEMSSGTRSPASRASCTTPIAIRSLEQMTPVGGFGFRSRERSAQRPPSSEKSPCATRPSASTPASRSASSRPAAFSRVGR